MFETFFSFLLDVTQSWGYLGIFVLMTIESSFIPFPSELVIPPAAFLAAQGEMNIYLVVLWGVLGSLCGASINYVLAMWLGRPLVYSLVKTRWAKYFLLSEKKVQKSEEYFVKNGAFATFIGRLIPAVRQLISLPAGFSRMKFSKFALYTSLGAAIWTSILAALGYFLGARKDLFVEYYGLVTKILIVGVVLFVVVWIIVRRRGKR